MLLTVNQTYVLRNRDTLQWANLEVLEVHPYKVAEVVYGERRKSPIWLPGRNIREEAPAGPACFPVFRPTAAADVEKLMGQLNSLPLYLYLTWEDMRGPHLSETPVLSWERIKVRGDPANTRKDNMMLRSQRLVDLFVDWQKLGQHLPAWALEHQNRVKQGLQASRI